jgi:signal transduction histidine kinase
MAPIIERLLPLLSVPTGNMIYATVLAMCSFAAWIACIYAKGKSEAAAGRRVQLGLLILFLVQLLLFLTSWLAWLQVIDTHSFLPTLDRTLAIFSLVLIIWLWAFPEPHRVWDALTTLAEVIILVVGVTGIVLWLRVSRDTYFNTSMLGGYAYYSGMVLLGAGIILLFWRRPSYWGYGLLMLLIMLSGYLAQFVISQPRSDYTWFVHLGESAFLFLLVLPKRLIGSGQVHVSNEHIIHAGNPIRRLDGKLIHSVTDVLTEPSPEKFYQDLTRLMTHVLDAEYCLLLIPPKTGEQLIIPVGYGAAQDTIIDGFTADGHKLPTVIGAVKNGLSLSLPSTSSEVQILVEELKLVQAGHLLVSPFQPKGISTTMGIAVLSSPEAPEWTKEDEFQLKDVTDALFSNQTRARSASRYTDQAEMIEKLQRAEAHVDQVRLEYAQLKAKYDSVADQLNASAAQADTEKALQEDISRLEERNRELEAMLARGRPSMEEVEQLRKELRSALVDLARIPTTLSKSDQRMLENQLDAVNSLDRMQPTELVTSIAQEFRQPIASIVGYTDLLLGESVGLLGAVQRKFLERVKASTERLGILINELVEVMTIDGGKVDKTPVSVELEPVIHEAVGNITAQLNEKNISIQLDLPDILPGIRANKDALLQILSNLLENACLATPANGEISLAAGQQYEGDNYFILLSITDQGGGIERTDITRVFQRRYKLENPLIKGVGDTGVGLSIVKSLVDLLKGRVWVDSTPSGSTFSVLLPMTDSQTSQTSGNSSTS